MGAKRLSIPQRCDSESYLSVKHDVTYVFQYLNGAIQSLKGAIHCAGTLRFQYLNGAIQS